MAINDSNSREDIKAKIGELTKRLIGDRSLRQTSRDANLGNASTLSYIVNGRVIPTVEVIRKITAPEAKPQNGVTFEEFMVTAGYQKDYAENVAKLVHEFSKEDEDTGYRVFSKAESIHTKHKGIIHQMSLIVSGTLSSLGFQVISLDDKNEDERKLFPDYKLKVKKENCVIENIYLDFIFIREDRIRFDKYIHDIMARLMRFGPLHKDEKYIIITSNSNLFKIMQQYECLDSYRGDVSFVLFDNDTLEIKNEVYFSHFNLDKKNEFFLI